MSQKLKLTEPKRTKLGKTKSNQKRHNRHQGRQHILMAMLTAETEEAE